MRYFRMAVIILFVLSLGIYAWANLRYYKSLNSDMPTITGDAGTLNISVNDDPKMLLQGLTAQDGTDGDLTDQIMVASVSHFVEKGIVNVKYVVFDAHNNAGSFTRKVCYTDYRSPRIFLEKPAVYVRGSNFDLISRLKVEDCIDGDISSRIRVLSNMVNLYATGEYPVVLEVTNSCGDRAQLTLWVTVLGRENTADIALSQYVAYIEQGETFDPYDYIRSVTDTNNLSLPKENVQIKGSVDLNTPGTYRIEYHYADENVSGQTAMTVVVESGEGAS